MTNGAWRPISPDLNCERIHCPCAAIGMRLDFSGLAVRAGAMDYCNSMRIDCARLKGQSV